MASGIVETTNQEPTQEKGQSRSKLVQRLLAASANLPQFVNDLLTTQAVVVAGTEAAGFVLERNEGGMGLRPIAHIRPDNSSAETRAAAISAFQEILKPCIAQGKDGAIEINTNDLAAEPQFCLVTLLRNEGEVVAASAVITRCMNVERAQQRLVSMQLVAGYFELYTLRRMSEQSQIVAQSHQHVLQLATAVATAEGFESAAMNLCNELATRSSAGRVTLGWIKGRDVRVKAFSHTEEFDKKQELIVQIEKVMEECIDQEEPVHYDPDGEGSPNVSRAAQALSRSQGGNTVLSLPLRRGAEVVGVVTLEFSPEHKLTQQASTGLSVAVDLLAPQLYDRYQNDRWLITKAGISTREMTKKVIGPHFMIAKLIAVGVIALAVFLVMYKPMYHVTAPFTFDAINKRPLDAPFDGEIKDVMVRAGDKIKKGQVLLTFHDDQLRPQLAEYVAQAKGYELEAHNDAADNTKIADRAIALANRDAALAQAAKIQDQIDQLQIVAPFDGVVLKGDPSNLNGATKHLGDELLVVSPDTKLRAELSVSEPDIQDVRDGANGKLATTGLPTQRYGFTISRIVPMGQPKEGSNTFTVYADMDKNQKLPDWMPGMAGEARIDVGPKRLIWIWTHKPIEYLRLKLWM